MSRKLVYIALLILLSAAILLPAINENKVPGSNETPDNHRRAAVNETAGPAAVRETPEAGSSGPSPGSQGDGGPARGDAAAPQSNSPGTAGNAGGADKTPAPAVRENGCRVDIAVVGMKGELLYGPGNVALAKKDTGDITALGALEATGLEYTLSSGGPAFVEAVAGQRNRGQSGWMYMVNNEIPMLAADQKMLKTGDKVLWWYSRSIEDPLPDWEGLHNRG